MKSYSLSKRKIKTIILIVCLVLNYFITPSLASEQNIKYVSSQEGIVLKGQDFKKVLLQRVFSIELYSQEHIGEDNILNDVSKAIHIESHRFIPRKKLLSLIGNWFDKNLDAISHLELANEIGELQELIIDLNKGDTFTIAYFPNKGTHFYLNNDLSGVIEGKKFAKVFYSIWLGDTPVDMAIKDNLLAFNR